MEAREGDACREFVGRDVVGAERSGMVASAGDAAEVGEGNDGSMGGGCIGWLHGTRERRRSSVSLTAYGVKRLRRSAGMRCRRVAFMDDGTP